MTDRITLRRPDDFHVHLREGMMMKNALPHTAKVFGRALVMPNLTPPVLEAEDAVAYRGLIQDALALNGLPRDGFEPLMTIKILPSTTPEVVKAAKAAGVVAGKVYPAGVTTNSEDGWTDFGQLDEVFAAMAECGIVLCLHSETPGVFSLDREQHFVETYVLKLATDHPKLIIILEHITSRMGCRVVRTFPNTFGTITVHHLLLTLDDMVGDKLSPHNFCKPIAKCYDDRDALVEAACGNFRSFFLGTDSAPHLVHTKHCASRCAGVYSAPVAMPLLTEIFEREAGVEWLTRLQRFASEIGSQAYRLSQNKGTIALVRKPWTVPEIYEGVVPFYAGKEIAWQIEH